MKQRTIWTIAAIMGFSFLALLYLQIKYIKEMANMKQEQFDESVNRALYQASKNMEFNETRRYLERSVSDLQRKQAAKDSTQRRHLAIGGQRKYSASANDSVSRSQFELKVMEMKPSLKPKAMILHNDRNSLNEASKSLQEIVKNRYVYQKALLDDVIYTMLYSASEKPLKERINFRQLDQNIRAELMNNGIDITYHLMVTTHDGREVYRCPCYNDDVEKHSYSQILFHNDPEQKMGIVKVYFPNMDQYVFSSVSFMIPAVVFTLVLLITFIFTIVVVFRQKKYSEMKNDFVNNMTHELKTPIASISLAAQMLNDKSINKSPAMIDHLSGIVNDESKRLRFLVEKVLQMSMFDKKSAVFKKKQLDLNEMVENIANSFTLRVEHTGGHIYTDIGAIDSSIYVDEVHFQNAIFNLLDNAVKYGKPNEKLDIYLKTWNDDNWLYLSVQDTGIGIKKEDQKKVFEKFYRVHTGNVHDVKGFGLGLAYVRKIVLLHQGDIKMESEYGKGTTFTIKLPVIKD